MYSMDVQYSTDDKGSKNLERTVIWDSQEDTMRGLWLINEANQYDTGSWHSQKYVYV